MENIALVVHSKKLEEPGPHLNHEEIYIINKESFLYYLKAGISFTNPENRLCILRYSEDHIIILEEVSLNVLASTDYTEYKVLTKDGVGYMLCNKKHEYFTPVD